MEIPLINPNSQGVYPQNMFYVPEWGNGKPAMIRTPGLSSYVSLGTSVYHVRAMRVVGDYLYALVGDTLYKITDENTYSSVGTVTASGRQAVMADNGTYLMIAVIGENGYTYHIENDTFAAISDADFPTPGSLDYVDNYFIVSSYDTQYFYISASGDPTSWGSTDYEDAERIADKLIGIKVVNGELWAGGKHSIEIYQDTGNASFPFERISGILHEVGVAAPLGMVSEDNSLFFLDDTRMFRRSNGYRTNIISPRGVAAEVQGYSIVSDCIGYSYVDKGSTFIVWSFPAEKKTWVYCVNTKQWHKWVYNGGRHLSNCYAFFDNKHLIGSYSDTTIYEFSESYYHDDGVEIESVLVLPEIWDEGKDIEFENFVVDAYTGVGLTDDVAAIGSGEDPQITMDYTDDRQRSWSNELSESLGKIGEYTERVIWEQLGTGYRRQFRVKCTDPCEFVISGAYFNVDL